MIAEHVGGRHRFRVGQHSQVGTIGACLITGTLQKLETDLMAEFTILP